MVDMARDCRVISLYYENAEATVVNEFFMETAGEEQGDKISQKIKRVFDAIIKKFKEFIEAIKTRLQNAKMNAKMRGQLLKCRIKLRGVIKDKETRKVFVAVEKVRIKGISEYKKLYDKFMRHQITFEDFCRGGEKIEADMMAQFQRIDAMRSSTTLIDVSTPKGAFMVSEAAKITYDLEATQTKIIEKIDADVIKEERRIQAEAAKAAKASDDAAPTVSAATQRYGNFLTRSARKAITVVVAVAGIAATLGWLSRRAEKQNQTQVNESVEDFYLPLYANSGDMDMADDFLEEVIGGASGETDGYDELLEFFEDGDEFSESGDDDEDDFDSYLGSLV